MSTPGGLLLHIRAECEDFGFEFERLLLDALGDAITMADEVSGFRCFDSHDLLGFVDGMSNPTGGDVCGAATHASCG
ncbi:Dyp-type peroxidase domain-containing protein [Specibacter cremeus]|uniref:Dyp-type peroxidase domain-containing protein n=1 Tax=Specibacter cremeus TaxID=1629051 RepID=UPI001F0BDD37|nr:Dyp-type peroxidase domain-containing protein [Specibacter cremeus]